MILGLYPNKHKCMNYTIDISNKRQDLFSKVSFFKLAAFNYTQLSIHISVLCN